MKVLVVGGGGREHALCWAISKSPLCAKLYCAPGNAGIAEIAECLPIPANNVHDILAVCHMNAIDFVVIGPDEPLALGMADELRAEGICCFGPSKKAAEIEWSKVFMKDLCARAGVPTAAYRSFNDADAARAYVRMQGAPIVVKADGLALGKGVTVARTIEEALAAIDEAMEKKAFGVSGANIVIEEFMEGEEVSFFALCDGHVARFFATAQDHKAAFDGDKGPNTGGMGAYSPAPIVDEVMQQRIMNEIINPIFMSMRVLDRPFSGILYAGLMITRDGPKVVEFNARFGDPECQVLLPRLKSDTLSLLYACAKGMLDGVTIKWDDRAALTVVIATEGYPGTYTKGSVIKGCEKASSLPDTLVFHAGTVRNEAGELTANGGRVLNITSLAPTIAEAQARAYRAVEQIDWPQGFCRHDIGWRAIDRTKAA